MKPTSKQPATHADELHWFGWTDIGRVRKNNEDSFLGLRFDAQEVHRLGKFGDASLAQHAFTFAVCDGMGGAKAGEFASNIAVEKITTLLDAPFRNSFGSTETGSPPASKGLIPMPTSPAYSRWWLSNVS